MGDEQVVSNDSQLSEEGNGLVPSTHCLTKAQSATDIGNINVNPELLNRSEDVVWIMDLRPFMCDRLNIAAT
ncbi:hypothetical protein AHAS_Ahas07G0139900 [Arachis hypogaea]